MTTAAQNVDVHSGITTVDDQWSHSQELPGFMPQQATPAPRGEIAREG